MKIKDSVKEFAKQAMMEANMDIDIEYCKKNSIKYINHEIDATTVDLFNTESNKAAFDFVTQNVNLSK